TMAALREKIIGLGERSGRKSHYPELRERLSALERFRALLDQTYDAIVVTDVATGLITDANQATCRMLECSRGELIGHPIGVLSTHIAERIAEVKPGKMTSTLRTRLGRRVSVEATIAFMGLGNTHYAVAVARDVTDRQRSERALQESEQRFRAMFEGAAIGIGVIDLAGRFQVTNHELQALLGRSAEELRDRSYLSLIDRRDQGRADEHHRKLVGGQTDRACLELRFARPDGRTFWAQASTSLVANSDGAPAYFVAAVQDISLRKRTQEALEFLSQASVKLASSLDVAATLNALPELAVPFLGDYCVINACASDGRPAHRSLACREHGDEQAAQTYFERCSFAGIPDGLPSAGRCAAPRLFADASVALRAAERGDSSRLALLEKLRLQSLMVIPLASGGRTHGTLLLATSECGRRYGQFDLELATQFGQRGALALDNARLLAKAQQANQLKDEFLAIVSHELRTPLTSILGWTGILKSNRIDPPTSGRGLLVIERNARALAQIIDDLLGVSRIIAGKLQINRSLLDLAPVVDAAVEALRPSADAHQIAVEVRCERAVPPVFGDAKRLQQVIWNLLSNAVKYTPAGGRVKVTLARSGGSAEISVADTGRGINPEFLPHVFERFRQADSSSTRRYGGLGLGLAIVRHLVEMHGGTVRAASEGDGRGACFTVTLPLGSGTAPCPSPPEMDSPHLEDLRVLVVEDDADTLELIGKVLQDQGAQVAVASSAREALTELRRGLPDVLVSDIAMPEEDGVALLGAIRARGWVVPALALTALARDEDRSRALAAGFERYLVKPVDVSELTRALAHLARRSPCRQQPTHARGATPVSARDVE
ncbi:MAG TPA: PAS domain S-box protein, partial [Anaeromyxobacteraceae bacterium]|nr:PAS domain S-box protein [Anaeromyxobacteraceae bacterium]